MSTPTGYGACHLEYQNIDEATYAQLVVSYASTDVVPDRHKWKTSVHFDVWMQEGCNDHVLSSPPDDRHKMSMGILCNILQRRDRLRNLPVIVSWHIDSIPDKDLAAWAVLCRDCFDASLSSVQQFKVNHDIAISATSLFRLGGMSSMTWISLGDAVHVYANKDSDISELVFLLYTLATLKMFRHCIVSMLLPRGMKGPLRSALCARIEECGSDKEAASKSASELMDDVSVKEMTEETSSCSGMECSSVSVSCQ